MSPFELFARSPGEEKPSRRLRGYLIPLRDEAFRLASSSGADGVMSVWIQHRTGRLVWAAGEKATELKDAGYRFDPDCNIVEAPEPLTEPERVALAGDSKGGGKR